jgi:hypothetical protein
MKKGFAFSAIFLLYLSFCSNVWSQNSLNSGDFSGGSWGSGQSMASSAGGTLIITKGVTTAGDKYFRFYGDGSPCGEYQPNNNGDFFSPNVVVSTPNSNCGSSNAWRINVPSVSSQVVFKTDGQNDGIDKTIAFVIQGALQSVSSVTQNPLSNAVFPGQTVAITASLSGALSVGQGVYLRYTNNNYTSSTVVPMSGSGTSYSATIPDSLQLPGSSVSYYVFTSGNTGPATNGSDADLFTINLNNNGGINFAYSVANGWTTAADGNWNSTGSWTANAVPPTLNNMGAVTINHALTQNVNAIASSILINSSGSLSGSANTLTLTNSISGTNFSISGTMNVS